MEQTFNIYEFRFVDKSTRMKAVIYARTQETAMKIISIWNDSQDIYHWVKPRFHFIKKMITSIPPYELENEQLEFVEKLKQKNTIK